MSDFVLSPRAKADLGEIWDYTAEQWDGKQAERYTRLIAAAIQALASVPTRGKACDYIRKGYRKYPVGAHVIFYRVIEGGIDVVRILHSHMDFARHLN